VFDVDGTLCDTCDVDDEMFCLTSSADLGVPIDASSWRDSPHVTDTGISAWLSARYRGRAPTSVETAAFATSLERAFRAECDRAPARFAPIRGSRAFLSALEATGCRYAIATGGRAQTARFKLEAAELPTEHLLASSDDSPDRAVIFELARRRRLADGGEARAVLVGDGVWDVATAIRLRWGMVGVGVGERADRLREAGARVILPDFTDRAAWLEALVRAPVPVPDAG
jgi:phosphoglycolate phosphatase-like HAD superfamily hydrolase